MSTSQANPNATQQRPVTGKQSRETLSRKHSERHHLMQVQNYVIYRKTIGAGSMGKVKLAECLTDVKKQKYAVKIMPKVNLEATSTKSKSKDPKDTPEEREQRTIREMAIMRLLRHPNICQLKEYITEGDKYYMFLEYVDGGQLLDYIVKNGRLKEKQARRFARQIVSALDYCHRNSIVHRDLKIENILITQTEQLKIIDFGLSNVYSPNQQLNTFCGSLYFAAPELLKARQYTGPEVDIWSFGVVLYVLVCGKVPFDDSNLPALHEKIKSGVVEEYPDYLGKDCIDLLTKIFVVDPSRRISLSAIKTHPWMNKGYEEPIHNYLPRRKPIERIDLEIVKGMNGFGLGSPEEIKDKLEKIITSPDYVSAAREIDQNYMKKESDDQQLASRPRWRRSLSTRKRTIARDDFQSLPAMYDPLVSIYYLVKERKESDERKQRLLNAEPNPIGLSRSASTLVGEHQPKQPQQTPVTLQRRKTYDTSKKLPELPPLPNGPPMPTASKSEKVRPTRLLRKKSLQAAAKKFGLKFDHKSSTTLTDNPVPPTPVPNSSKKNSWLKVDFNHSGKLQQRQSLESSSRSSSWKRLSMNRKSTRISLEQSSGNLPIQAETANKSDIAKEDNAMPEPIEKSKSDVVSKKNAPKSVFKLSHGQLFRMSPETMVAHLMAITHRLNINVVSTTDQFKLNCLCQHKQVDGDLKFSIVIYEARWAGGKIGFKLKDHDESHRHKQPLKDIYQLILNELEKA